jgi:hypothetical protein
LIEERAREANRVQKVLETANIKLASRWPCGLLDRPLPGQPRERGEAPERPHPARQPYPAPGPRRECPRRRPEARPYLAAQYRRLVKRRGDKKAIVAVAHSLLVIAYHVLRDGQPYRELGGDYFERLNADRLTRYHTKRLAALGYAVTLTKCAA